MNKLKLYLFVGYPGAGKTTVAKIIEQASGAVHLWADHERQQRFADPSHHVDETSELYRQLNDQTNQLLAAGQSVIFDTNFNYRRDRDHLRQIADKYGAKTLIIWLTTPKALARQRATHDAHRERNGYRDRMSQTTFNQLSNHLQEPEKDENFIKIDGTKIDESELRAQFSQ